MASVHSEQAGQYTARRGEARRANLSFLIDSLRIEIATDRPTDRPTGQRCGAALINVRLRRSYYSSNEKQIRKKKEGRAKQSKAGRPHRWDFQTQRNFTTSRYESLSRTNSCSIAIDNDKRSRSFRFRRSLGIFPAVYEVSSRESSPDCESHNVDP